MKIYRVTQGYLPPVFLTADGLERFVSRIVSDPVHPGTVEVKTIDLHDEETLK